jgi:hypothetical protein
MLNFSQSSDHRRGSFARDYPYRELERVSVDDYTVDIAHSEAAGESVRCYFKCELWRLAVRALQALRLVCLFATGVADLFRWAVRACRYAVVTVVVVVAVVLVVGAIAVAVVVVAATTAVVASLHALAAL